ncbi:MAG: outer membrane beta-barrel family protein, partial [Muribaculaceae bacterium]|nr:outer membrane beta-barrel family protein [Muribaculaceae bacterium]
MIAVVAILLPAIVAAQEPDDTIAARELDEIVVKAPKVIRKADMDVYHPSKSAVKNSRNGIQLLNNLMIPALTVSDALGSIQVAGQSVQIRINGRESTIDQVRALLPETIKRVEWIDNPGLRYGGANHVLNFITANPTTGGSLMTKAQPALNVAWGFYMADAKFNVGRSQWEVGGYYKLTNKIKTHRDYTETFTYNDETSITRDETSLGGSLDNSMADIWSSYNYIKPDTTVFMVEFGLHHNINERWTYNGLLSLNNGNDDILLDDTKGADGSTPSLSIYWQQNFAHKQMLVVSLNSSFYFGHSFSDYIEQIQDVTSHLTAIRTNIKDSNQAYAIEADYIKSWRNSRFTVGTTYTANRNRSQYENLGDNIFHQRQDNIYLFAEYFQRIGRWSATAGMGVQYTDFMFNETNQGNQSWSPRPQATIAYSLNQNHNFMLNFTSWQST